LRSAAYLAIIGVCLAVIIGLIVAITIVIIYYKRRLQQQKVTGQPPAIQSYNEGQDLHLDTVITKPDRSIHVSSLDKSASPHSAQGQDRTEYEEVEINPNSIRDVRPRYEGTAQYANLVSYMLNYNNCLLHHIIPCIISNICLNYSIFCVYSLCYQIRIILYVINLYVCFIHKYS
jgi:hypothetical protein